MSKKFYLGQVGNTITANNSTIKGVLISGQFNHTTDNTDFSDSLLTLESIQCKGKLTRHGKEFTLFSMSLRELLFISNWRKDLFRQFSVSQYSTAQILVAKGVATKQSINVPYYIDFGGFINLKNDDKFEFIMDIPNGSYNLNINTTTSQLQVDFEYGIGIEVATPYYTTSQIIAASENWPYDLKPKTDFVLFANYDKTDYLTASQVVSSLDFKSDVKSYSRQINQMSLDQQLGGYRPTTPNYEAYQSLEIYDGPCIQSGRVNLTLNSGNVVASKNVIISRYFYSDEYLINRASQIQSKIDVKQAVLYNTK